MQTSDFVGLTNEEVVKRRKQFGFNELPDREKKSLISIIIGIIKEPMIFLLIAIVIVYFLLGDQVEAFILMVSVSVIIGINLFQNARTEKALDALRGLASPSCDVIRGGSHITIPSRELVPGDLVLIQEGSRIPADARLRMSASLAADESLLTGESSSVDKITGDNIFSGTVVTKGHGVAEVTSTGTETEVGKIGDSLKTISSEETLLDKEVDKVVKIMATIAISGALLITLVFWLWRGDLLQGFLAGLTMSIAVLPEEFPVVLTVFMALGAWRLARHNVLARKSQAIETLGSASVLCTDKTGTLTENRMTVVQATNAAGENLSPGDKHFYTVIEHGVLASQMRPFDPMEEAFLDAAKKLPGGLEEVYDQEDIVKEYPFGDGSLSVVNVWGSGQTNQPTRIALKGASETVFDLCGLSEADQKKLDNKVAEFAREGLRVLAVAEGEARKDLPKDRSGLNYNFLGLVALADPIRPEAAPAVKLCHEAGIRVIMITGDYPETARRIAAEIGLATDKVLTGEEFADLSPAKQKLALEKTSVFSRVAPIHKLTIVKTLKEAGEVVAMTGDGVNDAPALKSAHIGIAMGKRGTDVAREASAIVLLDDNFASIVSGIRLGRRIFANLQKAMAYILTVHMPIIVMSIVPVVAGWPLVLLPIHIVFLEFIIDPSSTLIFEAEPEEPDAMKQPPRRLNSPLFNRRVVILSIIEGLMMSAAVLVVHLLTMQLDWSDEKSRAMTFLLITLMNIAIIFVISGRRALADAWRKKGKSPLLIVIGIAAVSIAIIYSIPAVTNLFKLEALSIFEISAALGISVLTALAIVPIRSLGSLKHQSGSRRQIKS